MDSDWISSNIRAIFKPTHSMVGIAASVVTVLCAPSHNSLWKTARKTVPRQFPGRSCLCPSSLTAITNEGFLNADFHYQDYYRILIQRQNSSYVSLWSLTAVSSLLQTKAGSRHGKSFQSQIKIIGNMRKKPPIAHSRQQPSLHNSCWQL